MANLWLNYLLEVHSLKHVFQQLKEIVKLPLVTKLILIKNRNLKYIYCCEARMSWIFTQKISVS